MFTPLPPWGVAALFSDDSDKEDRTTPAKRRLRISKKCSSRCKVCLRKGRIEL